MKRFLVIAVLMLSTLGFAQKVPTYVVLEAHASRYVSKGPKESWHPVPATYVIQHGKVIIHAHCGALIDFHGNSIDCESLPDPIIPIGEALDMTRDSYGLCWNYGYEKHKDAVCMVVDSEKLKQ